MLIRDVALDFALVDQICQNALGLVSVHIFDSIHFESHQKSFDGNLVRSDQDMHFLEEISTKRVMEKLKRSLPGSTLS